MPTFVPEASWLYRLRRVGGLGVHVFANSEAPGLQHCSSSIFSRQHPSDSSSLPWLCQTSLESMETSGELRGHRAESQLTSRNGRIMWIRLNPWSVFWPVLAVLCGRYPPFLTAKNDLEDLKTFLHWQQTSELHTRPHVPTSDVTSDHRDPQSRLEVYSTHAVASWDCASWLGNVGDG